jgi:hypothetical protein
MSGLSAARNRQLDDLKNHLSELSATAGKTVFFVVKSTSRLKNSDSPVVMQY